MLCALPDTLGTLSRLSGVGALSPVFQTEQWGTVGLRSVPGFCREQREQEGWEADRWFRNSGAHRPPSRLHWVVCVCVCMGGGTQRQGRGVQHQTDLTVEKVPSLSLIVCVCAMAVTTAGTSGHCGHGDVGGPLGTL